MMANLEYIHYTPHRPRIESEKVRWLEDKGRLGTPPPRINRLPQIFWQSGQPWREANVWALELGRNHDVKLKTVQSLLGHLHQYAVWIEQQRLDWRHFPQAKAERVLVRYRGALIEQRNQGYLRPSTTTARMNAVIRFYRYAQARSFISHTTSMFQERTVVIPYFDCAGFQRTMARVTTDISIPNRSRPGLRLEDGLLPLAHHHMIELIEFAQANTSEELYLMLLLGFFTGARLGTITTLRINTLNDAVTDADVPGMYWIPIGPGTGVDTKFDVYGHLMVPSDLMQFLKHYATSRRRLNRAINATANEKSLLFLTRNSNPYSISAVDREMVTLRRSGHASGLPFIQRFKFHQTRATFGTWLASICLESASVKATIAFVRRAMHHKNESTTFRYIKFLEHTDAKIQIANAFTQAFVGLQPERTGK